MRSPRTSLAADVLVLAAGLVTLIAVVRPVAAQSPLVDSLPGMVELTDGTVLALGRPLPATLPDQRGPLTIPTEGPVRLGVDGIEIAAEYVGVLRSEGDTSIRLIALAFRSAEKDAVRERLAAWLRIPGENRPGAGNRRWRADSRQVTLFGVPSDTLAWLALSEWTPAAERSVSRLPEWISFGRDVRVDLGEAPPASFTSDSVQVEGPIALGEAVELPVTPESVRILARDSADPVLGVLVLLREEDGKSILEELSRHLGEPTVSGKYDSARAWRAHDLEVALLGLAWPRGLFLLDRLAMELLSFQIPGRGPTIRIR